MANLQAQTSISADKPSEDQTTMENKLVLYLKNILKHQIIPISVIDLRDLVAEDSVLHKFVQDHYAGVKFVQFLKKYPNVFQLNADDTVQIQAASFCIPKEEAKSYDEVDGPDLAEYVSDQDSD